VARYDLGLSDDEFGSMTYALLDALVKRKEAQDRNDFLRSGNIAAAVINFSDRAPDRQVSPMDFVPQREEEKVDLRRMTPLEEAEYVMNQLFKKR